MVCAEFIAFQPFYAVGVAAFVAAVFVDGSHAEHRVVLRALFKQYENLVFLHEGAFGNAHGLAERYGNDPFQFGNGQFFAAEDQTHA